MDKKNTMLLTVIAVATLLVAVVGATFAYFTASNSATGSTTATVTTETIGAITVSNKDANMYLNLTAAQMQQTAAGSSYWATTVQADKFSATQVDATVAQLEVTGGTDTTTYNCSFDLTVSKSDKLATGDAAVVFTTENNATITGVTSGAEIDYAALAASYKVNFTRTGDTDAALPLVKVAVKLNNTNEAQGFAGETLVTSVSSSGLVCTVAE